MSPRARREVLDGAHRPAPRQPWAVLLGALVLVGAVVSSCSNLTGSLAHQVQQWAAAAPYDADNAPIEQDFTSLAAGYRERKLSPLHTACAAFGQDAGTLYDTLETPDTRLTDELNTALLDFQAASVDCYDASLFTSAKFRTYLRVLAAGEASYRAAQERLATFGVR